MASDAIIATLLLGGMCLAMWYLARLARRRMGVGAGTINGEGLRVVGKRPLDQKHALYVIEIAGGRHIMVGTSMDGGISKVDDITPDEYAAMSNDDDRQPPKAAKLRVANDADTEDATDSDDDEQRFATVGESFQMLLGKARTARGSRANRKASGE